MKKIAITGAGGFIGSHLVEQCVQSGYHVKAFVHYNSKNSWGHIEEIACKDQIEVVSGDIRDFDSVQSFLKGSDTVFHLAALIGIPYSYVSPLAYIRTNVEGTYNILEASRHLGLENVLVTSTSETYGSAQYVPIDELHPMVGQSPYSASKISADQISVSYYRSFNLPVKIVRPFNTYGPRQSLRAIIPTIIGQLLAGQTTLSLGSLTPTRDFTYVKDTANGFLEIAKSEKLFGEITNIGTSSEISIADLLKMISGIMGIKAEVAEDKNRIRPEKSEVNRLFCDNTKLLENTHWKPSYTLEDGIQKVVEWMKENADLSKSKMYLV